MPTLVESLRKIPLYRKRAYQEENKTGGAWKNKWILEIARKKEICELDVNITNVNFVWHGWDGKYIKGKGLQSHSEKISKVKVWKVSQGRTLHDKLRNMVKLCWWKSLCGIQVYWRTSDGSGRLVGSDKVCATTMLENWESRFIGR